MRYALALCACTGAIIAALFYGNPAAHADPTDTGIGHNAGLQVNCAFNPAFRKQHAMACSDISVESVASNGGALE